MKKSFLALAALAVLAPTAQSWALPNCSPLTFNVEWMVKDGVDYNGEQWKDRRPTTSVQRNDTLSLQVGDIARVRPYILKQNNNLISPEAEIKAASSTKSSEIVRVGYRGTVDIQANKNGRINYKYALKNPTNADGKVIELKDHIDAKCLEGFFAVQVIKTLSRYEAANKLADTLYSAFLVRARGPYEAGASDKIMTEGDVLNTALGIATSLEVSRDVPYRLNAQSGSQEAIADLYLRHLSRTLLNDVSDAQTRPMLWRDKVNKLVACLFRAQSLPEHSKRSCENVAINMVRDPRFQALYQNELTAVGGPQTFPSPNPMP